MLLNTKSKEILADIDSPGVYIVYGSKGLGKASAVLGHLSSSNELHSDAGNIQVISPEGESIGVEQINSLSRQLRLKQWQDKTGYIIITAAETMTIPAQNAFLKTLEELPENISLTMVTSDLNIMLPTIRSRSRCLYFPPPTKANVRNWAEAEFTDVDEDLLDISLVMSGYLPAKLVNILSDKESREEISKRHQLIDELFSDDSNNSLKASKQLQEYLPEVLDEIVLYTKDKLEQQPDVSWLKKAIACLTSSELLVTNVNKRYILDVIALSNKGARS
ncbi:MAG: hypothetical protein WD061_00455 [Candidatus Saccharimonadales bacterium]